MNIVNLIISLVSGLLGGNIAGAGMGDKSLGGVGNSITGLVGGGLGGIILQLLGLFNQSGAAGINYKSVLSNIGGGGVGGAVLMLVIALIKNYMNKKDTTPKP